MNKKEFVKLFESVLRNANVDVTNLKLIDDEHVEITFVGGGKRKVNIACDSYKAIMIDVLKYCEQKARINNYGKESRAICSRNLIPYKNGNDNQICDFHSDRYDANNPHESAALANYLVNDLKLQDLQEVKISTILEYANKTGVLKLQDKVAEKLQEMRSSKFFGR